VKRPSTAFRTHQNQGAAGIAVVLEFVPGIAAGNVGEAPQAIGTEMAA
jgi:hypothetical protein